MACAPWPRKTGNPGSPGRRRAKPLDFSGALAGGSKDMEEVVLPVTVNLDGRTIYESTERIRKSRNARR